MNEREPKTKAELQEAADLAHFYLLLHSAVCYGLVEWGGQVNVVRCEEVLRAAAQQGIHPAPDCVERITAELWAEGLVAN